MFDSSVAVKKDYSREIESARCSIREKERQIMTLETKIGYQEKAKSDFSNMCDEFKGHVDTKRKGIADVSQYNNVMAFASKYEQDMTDIIDSRITVYEQDIADILQEKANEISDNYDKIETLKSDIQSLNRQISEWEREM